MLLQTNIKIKRLFTVKEMQNFQNSLTAVIVMFIIYVTVAFV